jgi:general secretion pathway protein I
MNQRTGRTARLQNQEDHRSGAPGESVVRALQSGFTLLEVLVATLIMAIAVTGLLSSITTSLRSAAKLTDYDRAAMLGRQKMDEFLLATTKFPKNVPIEGTWLPELTGGRPMGFRARISVFDKPDGAAPLSPVLERVELEIWWMAGEDRRTFSLEGFRRAALQPEGLPQ